MKRRDFFLSVIVASCVLNTWLNVFSPCFGQGLPANTISIHQMLHRVPYASLIAYHPQHEQKTNEKNKIPLILIHGIAAENDKDCRWRRFLNFAESDPKFRSRFNVYLFRYDSSESVPELSEKLRQALHEFIQKNDNTHFKILAYSEGGLLAVHALQDPLVNAHTDKVIAIGTPFHGSPLANPDWISLQMKQSFLFSPLRLTHRILYWGARKLFPSFQKDFHWDNFDHAIALNKNQPSETASENQLVFNGKLMTYGSYFGAKLDPGRKLPGALGVKKLVPREMPRLRNPFSSHFFFSLSRNNISGLPLDYVKIQVALPRMPEKQREKLLILMAYNDGISPISSTLWLGQRQLIKGKINKDATDQDSSYSSVRLLEELKALCGSSAARLFQGVDHLDWMDGSTRTGSDSVMDLLHPDEPSKTIFQWFIQDLMTDAQNQPGNTSETTTALVHHQS